MIVGNGMLATAFRAIENEKSCIYAAGVSNSACTAYEEFIREFQLLEKALENNPSDLFVYFSTCSIADNAAQDSAYVIHKKRMEDLVRSRGNYLLFRLPQVAGRTNNPNTLLNYLNSCIQQGTSFQIWKSASRNIIDIDDVVKIAEKIISDKDARNQTINIANPQSIYLFEIVQAFELLHRKRANYSVIDRGAEYKIDISAISDVASTLKIDFENFYLERTLKKYYGQERK
jgi:nucleoside-diphosphate-sugar epimerase